MDHDLPPELAAKRDAMYARVTRRGRALRARRVGVIATVVAIVVALPIAAFAITTDRDGGSQHVAADAPTTTAPPVFGPPEDCTPTATTLPPRTLEIPPGTVAGPTVTMPDVVGLRVASARDAVAQAGFCAIQVRSQNSDTVLAGLVLRSDPAAGTRAQANSTVELTVSTGPWGATTPTTLPPPTATTVPSSTLLVCHNSTDPACGPFHYEPPITNQPARVEIRSLDHILVVVPDRVTMTVRATDPDGTINSCDVGVDWGDGSEDAPCGVPSCPGEPQGYGAWDPPKPQTGDVTRTFTHVYDKPGDDTITVTVDSGWCTPYRSHASATAQINAREVLHTVP